MIGTAAIETAYFERTADHLRAATVELFAAYGVAIEPSAVSLPVIPREEPYCVASIGYSGDRIRGVLVLAASQSAAGAWMAAAGVADWDFADTMGEFSNMLLGRLKGRMLREGVLISLATPVTICGTGLRLSMAPGPCRWHSFDGIGWQLSVRLGAVLEAGFSPNETNDHAPAADAGDAIIF